MMDKKANERLFLVFLEVSCLSVMLICFVLTLLGVIDIRIVNEYTVPEWSNYIMSFIMFMINTVFLVSTTMHIFDKRIVPICILIGVCYIIGILTIGSSLIVTIAMPFLCMCVFSKKNNILLRHLIIQFLFMAAAVGAYQRLSAVIKLNNANFISPFEFSNWMVGFIYSIDLYIFYFVLWKGVKKYASHQVVLGQPGVLREHCKEVLTRKSDVEDVSMLTAKQKCIFYALAGGWQILLLGAVLFIGSLNVGLSEIIIILPVFWISRKILDKAYHAPPDKCTLITLAAFYVLTKLSLPLSTSLFAGVLLTGLMTFLFYQYQLSIEEKQKLIDTVKELSKPSTFDIDTATEDEIVERCKSLKLKYLADTINFLVTHYIRNHKDVTETAKLLFMEEQSVRNKVCALKKKLNTS